MLTRRNIFVPKSVRDKDSGLCSDLKLCCTSYAACQPLVTQRPKLRTSPGSWSELHEGQDHEKVAIMHFAAHDDCARSYQRKVPDTFHQDDSLNLKSLLYDLDVCCKSYERSTSCGVVQTDKPSPMHTCFVRPSLSPAQPFASPPSKDLEYYFCCSS